MKLEKIKIVNFRSIKDLELDFYNNSRVLVGINEAGKSNILKAAALLADDIEIQSDDVRQESYEEECVEESFVEFYFTFNNEQINNLNKLLLDKTLTFNSNPKILVHNEQNITFSDLCKLKGNCSYKVDVLKNTAEPKFFAFNTSYEYKVCNTLKAISMQCPKDYTLTIDDTIYNLSDYNLIDIEGLEYTIPQEYLTPCKISDINRILRNNVVEIFKTSKPQTIYWSFQKENLLPNKVNLERFEENPNICIPLKNMFALAGYDKIKVALENAKSRTNGIKNLLTRVAETATKHFNSIWHEYDEVKFELNHNGENIEPSIKDIYNNFGLAQRSDGFQRFITFLLMISIKVRHNSLQNSLLIVDEPEISLHPYGAKFLRDELSKIAENNYVLYSTHSPFMIDEKAIEKHYRICKEKEKTIALKTNESNYMDEEVLYNAIGYSIFSRLKEKNIIFEGWRDKQLFKIALSSEKLDESVKSKFNNVGLAHAKGVISFKHITPIIELVDRECIVVSDNDEAAKKEQEKFNQENLYGEWLRYNEIDENCHAITGEDFIKLDSFKLLAATILSKIDENLSDLTDVDLTNRRGKIHAMAEFLKSKGLSDKEQKEVLNQIKEFVFKNIKSDDIEDSYFELMSKLAEKI